MNLTHEEMIEAAEDLILIMKAGLVQTFANLRVERLRAMPGPAPQPVRLWADEVARLASQTIGGDRNRWRDAALSALGYHDSADVVLELLWDMSDRIRDERDEYETRRQSPRREPIDPAHAPREPEDSIHCTVGPRKRGGR